MSNMQENNLTLLSLPTDVLSKVLALVPKSKYPMIACVSKHLKDLVLSQVFQEIRRLLRKDSIFIRFREERGHFSQCWYTLTTEVDHNHSTKNVFKSFKFLENVKEVASCRSPIPVDHEIFFIGSEFTPSDTLWIFNSQTSTFRQGPSMLPKQLHRRPTKVGGKIYAIDTLPRGKSRVVSFDLKREIWEAALPMQGNTLAWFTTREVSVDRKVFGISMFHRRMITYDTTNGSCETYKLPVDNRWWRSGICVIKNILFMYCQGSGLMWYDTTSSLWKVVCGLELHRLDNVASVGLAEYYETLTILWTEKSEDDDREVTRVWCKMINLVKREGDLDGTVDSFQLLGSVPGRYVLDYCLSLSG